MSHEYALRAHTAQDAQKWWETIRNVAGQVTNEKPVASTPTSPSESRQASGALPSEEVPGSATSTTAPVETTTAPMTTTEKEAAQEAGIAIPEKA